MRFFYVYNHFLPPGPIPLSVLSERIYGKKTADNRCVSTGMANEFFRRTIQNKRPD